MKDLTVLCRFTFSLKKKLEISRYLADHVKEFYKSACGTLCRIIFLRLSNQIQGFLALSLLLPSLLMKSKRELKKGRQQWQRGRQKTMIWLLEWGKIIALHVLHALQQNSVTWSAKWQCEITTKWTNNYKIFHSLYFIPRRFHQSIFRAVCQQYGMLAKSNNRKIAILA